MTDISKMSTAHRIAEETDSLMVTIFPEEISGDETCTPHLRWMLAQIKSGDISGDKAQRWLGFVQGVLVAKEQTTVDQLRLINSREQPND